MPTRAIWKSQIRFGPIIVPVKLYTAVEDRNIHFRLLHRDDLTPVEQHMVNPQTGEPVPNEAIRRGYETEEGDIVLLEPDELQALQVENTPFIEVFGFIDPSLVHHQWIDRPYYLGPDGDSGLYSALVSALEAEKKVGLAQWNMRQKRYFGVIRSLGTCLVVITLRYAQEVIRISTIPRTESRALEKLELAMAEQLVKALEGEFDPQAYRDEYRNRLITLLERKGRGEKVILRKPQERRAAVLPLADLLKKSLNQVEKERKVA
jgi:DNA end-binding protein Ku